MTGWCSAAQHEMCALCFIPYYFYANYVEGYKIQMELSANRKVMGFITYPLTIK